MRQIFFLWIGAIFAGGVFLLGGFSVVLADSVGQEKVFFVDSAFDAQGRTTLSASLEKITDQLYFYIEDSWWSSLSLSVQNQTLSSLGQLADQFEKQTYPALTRVYGTENNPGVDGDSRITILVHRMKDARSGYIRTADGYTHFEAAQTNEREMFYFAADSVQSPMGNALFAHEFMHLIYMNQKELKLGVKESVWMQEGYAEIAPTIAGYSDRFSGSYLEKRMNEFVRDPRNSLVEWQDLPADYGVVSMFFHYILDRYGQEVFVDVLHSRVLGAKAFEEALADSGNNKSMEELFEDWVIMLFLNDCVSYGAAYCYGRDGLRDLRIAPLTNFLPLFGDSELRATNQAEQWAGSWNKISGGTGTLQFAFDGNDTVFFRVPYAVQRKNNTFKIGVLQLDAKQDGSIVLESFGNENVALFLFPLILQGEGGFDAFEKNYLFSWVAKTVPSSPFVETPESNEEIQQLVGRIAELQLQVAILQAQLASIKNGTSGGCGSFTRDFRQGAEGEEVRCLQQVLNRSPDTRVAVAGPGSAGQETAFFGPLTKQAVVRFQEKYAQEILSVWNLQQGTGVVGPTTRAKLNMLLTQGIP